MSKLRFLFVLFSLIVLAAPARAQDREHGHGRSRGDAEDRRGNDRGDRNAERDDDENDDDNRIEDRNRNGRDDNDDENDDNDDDRRGGNRTGCIDANGNNVCNVINGSIPSTLPEMVNAVLISRGQLTRTGRSWLGGGAFTPQFSSAANRTPRQVTWLDRKGVISQMWIDTNRDGRADVVRLYRSGKLVRTVHR